MDDGDDGDVRLFAQIEPQPQGATRCEVSNKNIRQRTVVAFLVGGVLVRVLPKLRPAITGFGISGRRDFGRLIGFRLWLF
jgi:hypothetical protein